MTMTQDNCSGSCTEEYTDCQECHLAQLQHPTPSAGSDGSTAEREAGIGVIMTKGACAKTTTRCTIVTRTGKHIVGENWCENPQPVCPREPGDGYEKCKAVCGQIGHAEQVAVMLAGADAAGGRAFLEGHTYACMDCQHALFGAGVESLSIGAPR